MYLKLPTDEEVRNALLVKDVYNFRSRNYLLGKLENRGRKERVDVEGDRAHRLGRYRTTLER